MSRDYCLWWIITDVSENVPPPYSSRGIKDILGAALKYLWYLVKT
jgi:hypothetical protein